MTVASKMFVRDCMHTPCSAVFHPGRTCSESFLRDMIKFIPSNAQFFLPAALIPIVMKLRQTNKSRIKRGLVNYAWAVFGGYLIGLTIFLSTCGVRRILGRHTSWSLGFMGGFVPGLWVFLLPDQTVKLFLTSVSQALVGSYFRNKFSLTAYVFSNSKILQTATFMTCSAIILHVLRRYKISIFWFASALPPTKKFDKLKIEVKSEKDKITCSHKSSCVDFVLSGTKDSFLIGLALENAKILVKRWKRIKTAEDYFKSYDIYCIAFLTSYTLVYRLSYCLMNAYSKMDADSVHLIAAYFGGISFLFYPKKIIMSYALVAMIEASWKALKREKSKYPEIVEKIVSLPVGKIIFPVALGTLVHIFTFRNWMISSLGAKVINQCTNYKAGQSLQNVAEIVKKFRAVNINSNF